MPRLEKKWICKKCNKKFDTRDDANKCETSHFKIKKIVGIIYGEHRAPEYIQVEVECGYGSFTKDITYKLKDECWGSK